MPISAGITAVAVFSVGGIVGTLLQGPLIKAFGMYLPMAGEFVASVVLVWLAALIFENFQLMMVVTFVLGVSVQAAQAGLNVLAATYYPTAIRSTGVGWSLGIGRIGTIVGPVIGGAMLKMQWTPREIFLAGVVPALLSAVTVIVSGWLQGRASPYRSEAQPVVTIVH